MNLDKSVAFDVDGTLIISLNGWDTPNYHVIQMFKMYETLGFKMHIWSGGGVDYAARWADRLGLEAIISVKGSFVPDIAIDDQSVTLGKVNINISEYNDLEEL